MRASDEGSDEQHIHNDISGNVNGAAGQFGNVYGDVHMHASPSGGGLDKEELARLAAEAAREAFEAMKAQDAEVANEENEERQTAQAANRAVRAEDDKRLVKGCSLFALIVAVIGFIILGFYTREWVASGVVAGIGGLVIIFWGAGSFLGER
jgi:hypothetical protein